MQLHLVLFVSIASWNFSLSYYLYILLCMYGIMTWNILFLTMYFGQARETKRNPTFMIAAHSEFREFSAWSISCCCTAQYS